MINQRLAFYVQPNPVPPMNDEQIDVVANTVMNAINYAAMLDLDRQPRLSRTNAGNLTRYVVDLFC